MVNTTLSNNLQNLNFCCDAVPRNYFAELLCSTFALTQGKREVGEGRREKGDECVSMLFIFLILDYPTCNNCIDRGIGCNCPKTLPCGACLSGFGGFACSESKLH